MQINLEDLHALADESDELNMSTHKALLELFPMEMHEDLSNVEGNAKTKIEFVHTYITDKKSKLQNQGEGQSKTPASCKPRTTLIAGTLSSLLYFLNCCEKILLLHLQTVTAHQSSGLVIFICVKIVNEELLTKSEPFMFSPLK